MPTSPRSLTVDYGSLTMGGASTSQIHDVLSVELTPRSFSVEFKILISGTTDALFLTNANAFQDAVRTPFQDLFVTMNGAEIYDFRDSTRLGFNTRGRITNTDSDMNTRLARLYTVRFEGDLPADQSAGQPASIVGWREATVQVQFSSSQVRTVTISGEWTATPSPSRGARAAYEQATSGFAAYTSTVLTTIDSAATWRLVDENYNFDDHDPQNVSQGTVLRFQLIYDEIVFAHAGLARSAGVETTGSVVRQVLRISRERLNPSNSPGTRRLIIATATYEAWIDKALVAGLQGGADVVGGGLDFLWDGTIRGHVLNAIRGSGILSGSIGVISERPTFEVDANKISAVIVARGRGGPIIERRLTLEDHQVGGVTLVPIWDGKKRSRYEYDSPIDHQRVINETAQTLLSVDRELGLNRSLGEQFAGGRIIEIHSTTTPLEIGSVEAGVVDDKILNRDLLFEVFDCDGGRNSERLPLLTQDFFEYFSERVLYAAVYPG